MASPTEALAAVERLTEAIETQLDGPLSEYGAYDLTFEDLALLLALLKEAGNAEQLARAEAFDDAAAIIRKAETKCETPEEWLHASWTFSNEAIRIRRALEAAKLAELLPFMEGE